MNNLNTIEKTQTVSPLDSMKAEHVMITTNDLQTVNEMFEACGADKILRKPFRFKELVDAMNGRVAA